MAVRSGYASSQSFDIGETRPTTPDGGNARLTITLPAVLRIV